MSKQPLINNGLLIWIVLGGRNAVYGIIFGLRNAEDTE